MVVDGHGQRFLGVILPDAMEIELLLDFAGFGNWNAGGGSFRTAADSSLSRTLLQRMTQLSQM